MDKHVIEETIRSLEENHFDVFSAEDTTEAFNIFFKRILPGLQIETVSWGDSKTMEAVGVLNELKKNPEISVINTFGPDMSRAQKIYWRRQALLADLFLSGSNALTQKGQLVNLDMIGNRIGGVIFGPKHVVLFIGINKIVKDVDAAMHKIKAWTAPQNAIRHKKFKTPCQKTGVCADCNSPDRICNTWAIIEKSFPAGRIKIILINKALGL